MGGSNPASAIDSSGPQSGAPTPVALCSIPRIAESYGGPSDRPTTACLEIGNGLLGQCIQFTGSDIALQLLIPTLLVKINEPVRQPAKVRRRQLENGRFDLINGRHCQSLH